jgi:hypothetical protein
LCGAEVAHTDRAVRSVDPQRHGTAGVRRIGEWDARRTVAHRAGIDLDEGRRDLPVAEEEAADVPDERQERWIGTPARSMSISLTRASLFLMLAASPESGSWR